jgi:hypothetical protein
VKCERLGEGGVGIVVIDDHDVFATMARRDWETSSLVPVGLAGDENGLHVDIVDAGLGLAGCRDGLRHGCCGGVKILAFLAQVTFGSGDGLDKLFADEVDGDAGSSGEVASIDGFEPSGWDWAEAGAVQIVKEIRFDLEVMDITGCGFNGKWCWWSNDYCRLICHKPVAQS